MAKQQPATLRLKDIVKVYGQGNTKVKALKGINVSFRKNEFVSILGQSGCGKTTLLNIVGGLDRYTSGDLIISGKSTKDFSDKDWDAYRNNSIGFVFQSYNLIPHQTVLGNVELALQLSGIDKKERRERAREMLKKVGLSDQENKRPNQLSGGQMQRVAIARALINDPEIILADEPTGALDTETSIQVMDLLQEVAKDRLVIMVTHNPDIAYKYSTRIIKLVDGEIESDNDPLEDDNTAKPKGGRKPKMGFKTALGLSFRNLLSKRGRTILTSIAGSIGIFGVALVLALSNGFNAYMARMQTDTLSTYPLTISESSVDLSTFNELYESDLKEKFPKLDNVIVKSAFYKLTGMLKNNDLSDEFLGYLNKIPAENYYSIQYEYGFDMNDYFYTDITLNDYKSFTSIDSIVTSIESAYEAKLMSAMGMNTDFVRQYIPTIQEMPNSKELVLEQYDVLYGELPDFTKENSNKIVLIVDQTNAISDITLMLLGYISGGYNFQTNDFAFEDVQTLSIDNILNHKFYYVNNDLMFSKVGDNYVVNSLTKDTEGVEELEVVGILRQKENVEGILKTGIAYTTALTEKVINDGKNSKIVKDIEQDGYANIASAKMPSLVVEKLTVRQLAGNNRPSDISIYPKNFDSKEVIKTYLDDWNNQFEDGDTRIVAYSDIMNMMFGMLNTMVDAVTYVLVAFTSISLIVSSAMIGIITYTSVVERTKEIGVLRAMGASKGEISSVFNAETFLIGLFAGLWGVFVTYMISIPINIIIGNLVSGIGKIAVLNPFTAVILICVSILLTLVAGLFPAKIAAKKDPVVALRTE